MQLFTPLMLKKRNKLIHVVCLLLSVACLFGMLSQTAFAQTTYVITDGDQVLVHKTYVSDPAKVLSEAGFALNSDDTYTTQVTTEGVSEILVQRAQSITIDNCGTVMQVSSYGETLEALLNRLGILTDGNYQVSLALDTQTYDGMKVDVAFTVQNEEIYTVEIPYETTYCSDPTLPKDQEKVLVEGVSGQAQVRASVVYRNAKEQSRTVLEETVLQQPVGQVVAVGTGENVGGENTKPLIEDGVIVLPSGEVLTYTHTDQFLATAYTKTDDGCDEITATGTQVHPGVVAVDPTVIPYGTRMFIVTNDGTYIYGLSTAEDCGGGIIGKRLDLYFDTDPECWAFGRKDCTVYFLGDANWK